jgi:RimJ/RimL family protein N-acetyltransferase
MESVDQPVVRSARPGDFADWFGVFSAVVDEGRWLGAEPPVDRDDRRRIFDATLAAEDDFAVVAVLDGALVGGLGTYSEGGRLSLWMFVAAEARGRGAGGALLDECLRRARAGPAHKVTLQVWPHNEAALALYAGRGFVEEGRLRRHYRRRNGELWDVVLMSHLLDSSEP